MKEKSEPGCVSTLITLLFIVFIIYKFNSCGGNEIKTTTNNSTNKTIQLNHNDSIRLKTEVVDMGKRIDQINIVPNKARKQFIYFFGEIQDYRATYYNGYEAAKVAKNAFDNAFTHCSNILPPDSLPEDLKTTFSNGIEDISQYYFEGSKAFNTAMQTFNGKGDMSTIDEFKQNLTSADAEWKRGVFELASVQLSLTPVSELKKHKSKSKKQ